MKLRYIAISLLLCFSTVGFGQMTKDEIKEWKTKMKSLTPESYKQLVEDKEEADANVNALSADNTKLLDQVNSLNSENAKLASDVDDYKRAAKEASDKLTQQKKSADSTASASGTVSNTYGMYSKSGASGMTYKVQIGAFKKFNITKYFNKHQNFSGEIDDDGTMKYTLGEFTDYWEADKFKQFLREMGVEGAWVVAYKDGKRQIMKEAREGK